MVFPCPAPTRIRLCHHGSTLRCRRLPARTQQRRLSPPGQEDRRVKATHTPRNNSFTTRRLRRSTIQHNPHPGLQMASVWVSTLMQSRSTCNILRTTVLASSRGPSGPTVEALVIPESGLAWRNGLCLGRRTPVPPNYTKEDEKCDHLIRLGPGHEDGTFSSYPTSNGRTSERRATSTRGRTSLAKNYFLNHDTSASHLALTLHFLFLYRSVRSLKRGNGSVPCGRVFGGEGDGRFGRLGLCPFCSGSGFCFCIKGGV